MATAVPNRLPRWARGVAYAALSCSWALGGTAGAQTISPAIVALARAHDPLVYAALWLGALVKVISGVVVLALIHPWGRVIPRWLLLMLAWGAGTLLFVHGGLFFVVGVLALSGTIRIATPLLMLRWYTFLWGPWWLAGGILFLLVAWIGLRRSPNGRAGLAFSALGVCAALVLLPPSRRNHRLSGKEREGATSVEGLAHEVISTTRRSYIMKNYYALINRLTTKPGKRDEVLKVLLEAGKPFQENAACILYLVYKDVQDPNVVWVEDLWTSKEEHTAALARPEVQPFVAQAFPLLESMPEQREVAPVGGKGL